MNDKKTYIIDTNVIIHDPQSIFGFAGATLTIPMMVLEELDTFKNDNSERGRNVREAIRLLDMLRGQGSLRDGVPLDNGGILRVVMLDPRKECSRKLDAEVPDNYILNLAGCLKDEGYEVEIVSKDLNLRVKADVIGIKSSDYLKDEISPEHFYKGWITFQVPSIQLKKPIPQDLIELSHEYNFSLNEYAVVEAQNNPHVYRLFRYIGNNTFKAIEPPPLHWGIEPRNVQQLIALDLLFDESIQLVTLLGPAGTGKTFLTLVAGLHKLLVDQTYEKILISRPVVPLGADIGYLPGSLSEKLHSWMQPIYDNMELIVHIANSSQQQHVGSFEVEEEADPRYKKNGKKPQKRAAFPTLDELIYRRKLSLEAITYMRGRSIPYQFIFIDEVQNLTPHEVKTIISRVGEGSKIILTGDPYQIDSPYLDFISNGLMVASQRFRGQQIFGTAFLETSERSELSKLAGKLL